MLICHSKKLKEKGCRTKIENTVIRRKDNADNATNFFVFDEIYFFIVQL